MNGRPELGAIGGALRAIARALFAAPQTSDLFARRAEALALRPVALDRDSSGDRRAAAPSARAKRPRGASDVTGAASVAPARELLSVDDSLAPVSRRPRPRIDARTLAGAVIAAEILAPPLALRNEIGLRDG